MGDLVLKSFNLMLADSKVNTHKLKAESIEELLNYIGRGLFSRVGFMLIHEETHHDILKEVKMREVRIGVSVEEECYNHIYDYINKERSLIYRGLLYNVESGETPFSRFIAKIGLHSFKNELLGMNQEIIDKMCDFMIFYQAMSVARMLWIPQAGAGSQDREYSIHKTIAEFILKKEKELHEEYKEDNSDYDYVKDDIGKADVIWY